MAEGGDDTAHFARDRWIAEEFEPQGPYRDGIISVRIPRDDYAGYWHNFESPFHSSVHGEGIQLEIPAGAVSGLNTYLRQWPT